MIHPACGIGPEARCQMQRGESRGKGQADLPAEQPAPCPRARLPAADAHPGGPRDRVESASQGPPLADCLIRSLGVKAVLSARNRMTRSTDFGATVKHGTRAVQPDLVIYVRRGNDERCRGAEGWTDRFAIGGLGRATASGGPAAAPRRSRLWWTDCNRSEQVVIRALPSSRDVVSARLEQELRAGLRRDRGDGIRPVNDITSTLAQRLRGAETAVVRGVIFLIQLYRHMVSPLRLPTCRFTPTCSQYAVDALAEYGLMRGSWLAAVRLAKCGPWHRGGWDPIPERRAAADRSLGHPSDARGE